MKTFRCIVISLTCICLNTFHAPAGDLRIGWDFRSYHTLQNYTVVNQPGAAGDNSHYPRIKRLNNGDLLMVFMDGQLGNNIYSRKSTDNGLTWSNVTCVRQPYTSTTLDDYIVFACPDFLELPDGDILLVYQWRCVNKFNDYPNTNLNAGIELIRSHNHGTSFDPSTIRSIYAGRNWEPSLLQLPSGEIQMFFTDSHKLIEKSDGIRPIPSTGMVRSFDNGLTWVPEANAQNPSTVHIARSLEGAEKYMDGMPVGQCLDDGRGIAVALECDGGAKTPWIVWSSMEANWDYTDFEGDHYIGPSASRRWLVHNNFRGFAPYMAKLPTGEILVQSNGQYNNENGTWLFIGDENARNFDHPSKAFRSIGAWWGSVAYIGDNQIISAATAGYNEGSTKREIHVTKGYVNRQMYLSAGDLPDTDLAQLDKTDGQSWFVGYLTQQQCFLKMSCTREYLHVRAYVYDRKINASNASRDGIQLLLYRANRTFRISADVQDAFLLEAQNGPASFGVINSDGVQHQVSIDGTLNNNNDTDTGFIIEFKIPWTAIGGTLNHSETCRMHPKMPVNDSGSIDPGNIVDEMCGQQESVLSSWLTFTLPDATEIRALSSFSFKHALSGHTLRIDVPSGIRQCCIYDVTGHMQISRQYANASSCELDVAHLSKGIYILEILNGEGERRSEKISM
jgi:hypothetical protein